MQYENLRVLLLGRELGLTIQVPNAINSIDVFDSFVTSAYVAVRETLAEDASFFNSAGLLEHHPATKSIYLLRTARQHGENKSAVNFYETWLGKNPIDWEQAKNRLIVDLEGYLFLLIRAAQEVRVSPTLLIRWKESDSVSVPSVFASVCHDLQLTFTPKARNAKVRAVQERYRREKRQGTKLKIISDFCVQEALSESDILPVEYAELLDELGLLNTRDAQAAISLAYSTALTFPELRGEDFKRKTSELWWTLLKT